MKNISIHITLLFASLFSFCLSATSADYKFHSLGVRQGLSSSTVNTMLVDRRGMLWIGTSMGLNRYDGYEVRSFRYFDDENKLPAANISRLMEDAQGNIWIDYNGEMTRYNMSLQAFTNDSREYFKTLGVQLPQNYNFTTDDNGNLWFTCDGIISCYDYTTKHLSQWKVNLRTSNKTWHFAACAEGLYLTDEHNVWRFISKTGSMQKIPLPQSMRTSSERLHLYVDSENTLWVYSTVSELVYHHGGAQITIPKGCASNAIRDIFDDGRGSIWVATDHNGVFIFARNNPEPRHILQTRGDVGTMSSNNVTCITADRFGVVYLGHFKTGVSITDAASSLFSNRGQSLGDISTIFFDRQGRLWLGTDGDGVYVSQNGNDIKLSFPSITISSFLEDHNGTLWIGTYSGGLYRMNGTSIDKAYTSANGTLPDNGAWQIAEDNHHNIWVASAFCPLYRFSIDTEKTNTVLMNGTSVVGLSLAFDGKHTMYVGTYYGVWAYDTNTGKAQCLLGNRRGTQRLLQASVVSLTYDRRRNALWVAHSTGISVLDIRRDSLFYFNEQNGLFDSYVKSIVEDKQGNMWLSTGHGISCIQAQKGGGYVVHNFSDRVGIQNTYFNTFAAACSPTGEILMGGNEGLTLINPSAMYVNGKAPVLTLAEVTVGTVHATYPFTEPSLTFAYDDRQITLHFFTGDLSSDGRVLYAYRVKGLTDDWTYTSSNKIEFLSLPHGSYTLEVKATDDNGEWGEVLTVKIRVTPPFYLSWWMMLIYAVLIAATIYATYRYMRRRQHQRINEQRLLMEQNQQVQLSEMKLRFFTNISHDLRTPLTLIISPLQSMIAELKRDEERKNKDEGKKDEGLSGNKPYSNDQRPTTIKGRLEMIYRNAQLLYNQVNMLLDFRRLDVGAESLRLQSIDVAQYVGNVCLSFHDYAQERNITLDYKPSSQHVFVTVDAEKLNKIMYNLLSNAFKYTPDGGSVKVKLEDGDSLTISVADTGCGISDADKGMIFQRFYQVNSKDAKAGSGIGLHIVNEYVNMMGGTVSVTDNTPQGSIFTVELKKGDNVAENEGKKNEEEGLSVIKGDIDKNMNGNEPYSLIHQPSTDQQATTILVVDDNPDLCTFISDSLRTAYQNKGYHILTASDGQEALDILASNDITLVVTDIMMPRIDGMELCRRIKSDISMSHIPVIMLTAKQTDQDIVGGLKLGADDYITKPFNIEHLTLRIDKFIEWTRNSHENFQRKVEVKPSEITITPLDEEFVEKAVSLVEMHMADSDYSVEDFSSDLNMSRANLYKKMMSIVGMGPHDFMRSIRLKRAHQLLERSQKQVSEIAYAVGFSSPKRFSENFKAEYGMTPSEFVKSCKGK